MFNLSIRFCREEGLVVDDRVVEEVKEHGEIGLQGFGFNLFDKDKRGLLDKD